MLRLNMENHCLEMMEETSLKEENILERYDLQKTILSSWDLFKNEIELPDSFLIGEEIKPHEATNDSSLIVIELKRNKNRLQLLHSLSYAAMINTWNSEKVIANTQTECNPDSTENAIISFLPQSIIYSNAFTAN